MKAAAANKPMLLLDRDGVLNVDTGYVGSIEDFQWMPGALETLLAFSEANWRVCVVTNQSGIARGYFSEADVIKLHAEVRREANVAGACIDAFYYCPYHPDGTIEKYRIGNHPDRKPNPGMLLRALSDFHADVGRSMMIGDSVSDVEAGRRAGVAAYHFNCGGRVDDFVARCLLDWVYKPRERAARGYNHIKISLYDY